MIRLTQMPAWLTKILLLLLSVALLSLALAPVGQFYLAWIGLVPWLIVLTRTRSKKSAFMWSWIGGTIFFAVNMWWLWKVTLPGMIVLFIYLGVFWGFAGWILVGCGVVSGEGSAPLRVAANHGWKTVMIPIVWTALEWVRGNWSMFGHTGLPWLNLGATQSPFLLVCQIADFGGVYAVTFWVVLINALLFQIYLDRKNIATLAPAIVVVGAITVAICIYGSVRMRFSDLHVGPTVVVIQPNYPQSNSGEKGASLDEILKFHVETTRAALADCAKRGMKVDLIAWSETMMPPLNFSARETERQYSKSRLYQSAYDAVATLANENDVALIVGGAMDDNWEARGGSLIPTDRRNSAYLFERSGLLSPTRYDKIHLVPFGEFIPYDSIGPVHQLLMKLGPSGYEDYVLTPGDENAMAIFDLQAERSPRAWRFVTPICFEDLVGPLVAEMFRGGDSSKRADFIVNLTNDGWFTASEMSQHFQSAIFRSIENRVPTARVVNTGISGFIDSFGRVHDVIGAQTEGWQVAPLSLDDRVTFYTLHGDLFVESCAVISAILILWVISTATRTRAK